MVGQNKSIDYIRQREYVLVNKPVAEQYSMALEQNKQVLCTLLYSLQFGVYDYVYFFDCNKRLQCSINYIPYARA